jgi:hypothetical protein
MDQENKPRASKQALAKEAQGYDPTPAARTCSNCAHKASEMALADWMVRDNAKRAAAGLRIAFGEVNKVERSLRCGVGGFAIKKMGTCTQFQPKESA